MIFLIAFVCAFLLNIAVTVFGKQDIEALKQKISLSTYLSELNKALTREIGDTAVTVLKLVCTLVIVIFVLFNFIGCILTLISIVVGTLAAKWCYKIPAVSNVINKIATYINRLR